ncbi:MAG: permease [Rhodothermaceae bacterium]|nr:MAG: ABC transporter permease [Bacteroidota bacterium]GIV61143.1 MAG: permease [Rhodothermaceae bacterium]
MALRFEQFVALRYLRQARGREEGRRFLHFVTYVSVGGVAVGVAALLLALSIVRGFSREIEQKIVGFGAHVQVESLTDTPVQGATALAYGLAAEEGVARVAPVVQEFALLRRSATHIDGIALVGTDTLPPYLARHLVEGTARFGPNPEGLPGLVIGSRLARLLGLKVGDRVTAFSMRNTGGDLSFSRLPRVKPFYVAGIYETSFANFDELYVFTDLDVARALLEYGPDEVTRFDLTLDDPSRIEAVAERINERWGYPIMARTIYEVYHSYFAWVNLQQSIIPLVIGVIILVAAFNLIGTLLMIILEKTREIGVLVSLGASPKRLRRLYLWLGLLIGGVGTLIGEGLALALALVQQRYGVIPLPPEAYYMKTAPVEINPLDFALVALVALSLCAAAAYIPARVAARIEPIRAIRFY